MANITINTGQINAPSAPISVGGVTLSEFRVRLRTELSGYAENSLISDTPIDTERQFINDGIGQLWPYDYQVVMRSLLIVGGRNIYVLPTDCEHVFEVFTIDKDVNEQSSTTRRVPMGDGWSYSNMYIDASTILLEDNVTSWTDAVQKSLTINNLAYLGQSTLQTTVAASSKYLIVKYARRWPSLVTEVDFIDPSPQRVQAVIHFAAAAFFSTQFQVNTESVRARNYITMQQAEMQLAQVNLIKDPKTLYMV